LSDHSLPSFDSHEALSILKKSGLTIPFILVTATMTDEFAVKVMKEGVDDYILKDRLHRLTSAVVNALEKHKLEKEHQQFLSEVIESEEMLKAGEKIAHFGTWQTDFKTRKSKWSDEAYRIFGLKPGEVEPAYVNFMHYVHADDKSQVENAIKKSINDLEPQHIDFRVLNEDGTVKWVRSEIIIECDSKKEPLRVIGFNHDITEIIRAGELLRKSEANLRAIFDNSDIAYILLDMYFNVRSYNKIAEDWCRVEFKMPMREGRGFLTHLPYRVREKMRSVMQRVLSGETVEFEQESESDRMKWFHVRYHPVKDISDNIIGLYIAAFDITKRKLNEASRKLAETKLAYSESRLKEAQAIAHIGNWEIDLITGVHTWSDEMYQIFNSDKKTAIPSSELFLSFIHPEDISEINSKMKSTFEEFANSSFDFRFMYGNSVRYGYSAWNVDFDENNNPTRLFGILQDVTERKLSEMERSKMVNDLMLRNKDLEQFAYIVSHNLRAPVANILGAVQELNQPELTTDERFALNYGLNESVIKLDAVIKDLNLILQTKREIDETKEKIFFSKLVEYILISIKNLGELEKIEVETDFSKVNEIISLKSYLYSIFYNLISNSIKYRKKDITCRISIRSELKEGKIILYFSDNGLGIDLQKKGEHVFGLYKRFHSNVEGKGMGLFMVKTQVETLGGKINVASKVNEGTEFKIELEI
jgi:PAS domain S-box-containing protein